MRHPNVVVFKESLEIEEKGEHVIYLVTEPVTPLASFLETTELTGQDRCRPEFWVMRCCWGVGTSRAGGPACFHTVAVTRLRRLAARSAGPGRCTLFPLSTAFSPPSFCYFWPSLLPP